MSRLEIQPATLAQVSRTDAGQRVLIDDDVQNVARDLHAIDPSLRVEYDFEEEFFVVFRQSVDPDGSVNDELVTTAKELDARVVERIRQIDSSGYDFVKELEKAEREGHREREHQFSERVGPHAERLAHALRKDLGLKSKAFIPGEHRE